MLHELRLNLVKNGLVSSQFCSKLARAKLESYLHDFLLGFGKQQQTNESGVYAKMNAELRILIDIMFHFSRKISKPSLSNNDKKNKYRNSIEQTITNCVTIGSSASATISATNSDTDYYELTSNRLNNDELNDDEENNYDDTFKNDIHEWIYTFVLLTLSQSERRRCKNLTLSTNIAIVVSQNHFENILFILQHILRSPESYAMKYSYYLQVPLLLIDLNTGEELVDPVQIDRMLTELDLLSPQSDMLVNCYFDFYLKLLSSFSYEIKHRQQFLFIDKNSSSNVVGSDATETNSNAMNNWQFVDLDGDIESIEQLYIQISEDDLMKLYYQIPFNAILRFLNHYFHFQQSAGKVSNNDLHFSSINYLSNAQKNVENSKSNINTANINRNNNKDGISNSNSDNNGEFRKRYVAMKIISFLDYVVRMSIRSLLVYNRLKYKNFSKLVGKTLRESVRFASYLVFKLDRNDVSQVRMHYEQLLKRTIITIIYSPRLRSIRWTVLCQLDLASLNMRSKWIILSMMCGIDVFNSNFETMFNSSLDFNTQASASTSTALVKPRDYIVQACEHDLESMLAANHLKKQYVQEAISPALSDIELLSFMRAVHFLILSSGNESPIHQKNEIHNEMNDSKDDCDEESNDESEKANNGVKIEAENCFDNEQINIDDSNSEKDKFELMTCVIKVIFKIAFCYESTKEICYKEGSALLFALCFAHPRLIGVVLSEIDLNLFKIGKRALFLTSELPFNKWLQSIDSEKDIDLLRKCLLCNLTNSIMFRMAMNCIDNIDFSMNTRKISSVFRKRWCTKQHTHQAQEEIEKRSKFDLADLFIIKICVILFELHSRLTIYNYFNKTIAPSTSSVPPQLAINDYDYPNTQQPQMFQIDIEKGNNTVNENQQQTVIDPDDIKNVEAKEELANHYSRLPKDKRLALVTWIWSKLNQMK
jgi:hypothetical protein